MAQLDLVGLKEIAERLHEDLRRVQNWRANGHLPPEEGFVSGKPAWRWKTIETHLRKHPPKKYEIPLD